MAMKVVKPLPVKDWLENIEHQRKHLEELREVYPKIQAQISENNEMVLYSSEVNSIANEIRFDKQYPSTYVEAHYAQPFKEVETNCKICLKNNKCNLLTVNAFPERIPLFITNVDQYYNGDLYLYATSFEDTLKQYKFSKYIVKKCRMYIIDFLKKLDSSKKEKVQELYIPNSVKKLMIFS